MFVSSERTGTALSGFVRTGHGFWFDLFEDGKKRFSSVRTRNKSEETGSGLYDASLKGVHASEKQSRIHGGEDENDPEERLGGKEHKAG